jgi:hypothetical protein
MIEAVQGLQVKCTKVFCPVYTLHSLGEKAGETRSSQAPASDCPLLLFPGIHRASTPLSLFPPSPPGPPNVANAPPLAGYGRHFTTPLCLSCLGRSDFPPGPAFPAPPRGSTGFTSTSTNPDDWLTTPLSNGPGAHGDADDGVGYCLRPSVSLRSAWRDT